MFCMACSEHRELTQQIQHCSPTDYTQRRDLERALDELVTRMEAKGEQISRLRKLHSLVSSERKSYEGGCAERAATNSIVFKVLL